MTLGWLGKIPGSIQILLGLGAFVGMLYGAFSFAADQVEEHHDGRYVLKGELVTAISDVVSGLSDASAARTKLTLEGSIRSLEDEIVWHDGQGDKVLARKSCRTLVRSVREWEELTASRWTSDPVTFRVCME